MIVQPNFSEKELLKVFERDLSWNDDLHHFYKFKNNYTISLFVDLIDPGIILSFYHNAYRLAVIRYYCHKSIDRMGFSIHNAEYCIASDVKSLHGTLSISQSEFREWLFNITEFSEWSIWNQV